MVSTSSFSASFAGAGNGSALRAATVWGGAASARGEEVQNQTPVIKTAVITLASIRPNALRIANSFHILGTHTRNGSLMPMKS